MTGASVVVGVDSAELSGIAILRGQQLVKHGAVTIAGWEDVERVADRLAGYSPDVVVIEDCFIRPNDHTGIVLAKLVGRWEQAFQSRGFRTCVVLASRWQPAVLPISHRAKRADRKAAAVAFARETFGVEVGEDVADAIGIAVWARDHAPSGVGGRPRPSVRSEAETRGTVVGRSLPLLGGQP